MCTERQLISPQPAKTKGCRLRNLFAGVWFTFFALLAAWNFFGASSPPVTRHVAASPIIAANAATPPALFQIDAERKPRFAAKPIRYIQPIADRVIARNPEEQPVDENLSELDLSDLSETEMAEVEAELTELLDNEPLPALIEDIADEAELVAFNDEDEDDEATKGEPTRAERLYDDLLAAAQALNAQPPTLNQIERTDYGPLVREDWRIIRFLLTRADGDVVRITLARPTWWLEEEAIKVSGQYEFDMEEVGAVGTAKVVSIAACPDSPRRQNEHHRLVTGKFEHEATNVIDLYVEGQDDPIGTTANHPFWSEDRQAFVEAESLKPGENLKTAADEFLRVISHAPRPGPQTVYNLEVDGAHVYEVSDVGILVHNSCNSALGHLGEWMARRALTRLGFKVLGSIQNASGHGIDLVVRRGGKIFVVEVKASFSRWRNAGTRSSLVTRTLGNIAGTGRSSHLWGGATTRARHLAALVAGRGSSVRGLLVQINLSAGRTLRIRRWP